MGTNRNQLYNDQEEAMRLILDGRQVAIWTAMPAYVTAVDLDEMTIEAKPTIQAYIANENGQTTLVNLPLLLDVPIVFPSAGGFTITLPIAVGDEVLIIFASRCIDSWFQSGGIQKPMEARMHDLSDGFAIPGPKSLPNVIPNISSTGAQIRNNAGTTYIEISADGKIKMVTPSEVDITGNLKVTGTITATVDVVGAGTSLHSHTHPQSGGGNTGAPNP